MSAKERTQRKSLSRELILDAALQVVQTDEMHELTMGRLGRVLDADPSAVYRHFRNKDELLLAMSDLILREVASGFVPADEPIDNIRRLMWAMRKSHLRRPGLALQVAARFTGGSAEAGLVNTMISSVEQLGYERPAAVAKVRALAEMTLGHVMVSAGVVTLPAQEQRLDIELSHRYYDDRPESAPDLTRADQVAATSADSDGVFETMLETFLSGLSGDRP